MFRLLIASTLVVLALGKGLPDATESEEFKQWSGRIVGGSTATPGQFPYQTSMRSAANAHFCGGFIITTRWVGCAAHCTINRTPANTVVVVGAHNRITGGISHPSDMISNHPQYNSATLAWDVSIVRVANPIVFTDIVAPIALAREFTSTQVGASVSGWGATSHPGGSAAEFLQYLVLDIITNEDCRSRLSTANANRIGDSTLCTLSPNGQGLCFGDSGGPLTYAGRVEGTVSWGVPCGTAAPDMFGRISAASGWMDDIITNNP